MLPGPAEVYYRASKEFKANEFEEIDLVKSLINTIRKDINGLRAIF